MTEEEILHILQDIFRDVFDDEELVISEETSPSNIEEWDSLNHINIISIIEREFNLKFKAKDLMSTKDVKSIIELIRLSA